MNTPEWIIDELNRFLLIEPNNPLPKHEPFEMVENFEELTANLNDDELLLVPIIVAGIGRRTKENPVTGKEIVQGITQNQGRFGFSSKFKFTETRLRKIVNYIRVNHILCIIATSQGYFSTNDPEVIASNIRSLEDRAEAIRSAADGLRWFLPDGPGSGRPNQATQTTLF